MVYSGAGVGVEVTEVGGMGIGLGKSVMSVMFLLENKIQYGIVCEISDTFI